MNPYSNVIAGCCERLREAGMPKLLLGDRFLRFICDRCCDSEQNDAPVKSQLLRLQMDLSEVIAILLKNASGPQYK
jgi:hypothetical protein